MYDFWLASEVKSSAPAIFHGFYRCCHTGGNQKRQACLGEPFETSLICFHSFPPAKMFPCWLQPGKPLQMMIRLKEEMAFEASRLPSSERFLRYKKRFMSILCVCFAHKDCKQCNRMQAEKNQMGISECREHLVLGVCVGVGVARAVCRAMAAQSPYSHH